MSSKKGGGAEGKARASNLVPVKVRMEQSIVDQLDAVKGSGSRAELIRDLVAHRLTPHPALASSQLVHSIARELERRFGEENWIANRYQDDPVQLEGLRKEIRLLTAAARDLQVTMARDLLQAAGITAPRP